MLRSVKYGLYGAVLAGVIAGAASWQGLDKSVTVLVDGQQVSVRTTASRVSDVLHAAGYTVGDHDLVAPAASATIDGGSTIVYRRGRLLHLDVNGIRSDVWTTAPTIEVAMQQLGFGSTDFITVSRDRRLPLSPTFLTLRTPLVVTVVHDGMTQQVTTGASTVGALLSSMDLALDKRDRVKPAVTTALSKPMTITVQRVTTGKLTTTRAIPYTTSTRLSATMASGATQLIRAGKNGTASITYAVVYVDGKIVGRTKIKTVVVTVPVARIVKVGTKPAPTAATASAAEAQAIARKLLASRGWDTATQWNCLAQLWGHESGWRVTASNPSGAYGIPQALPGSKMSIVAADWRTSARTQIIWGLGYIASSYGTPCGAWQQWQSAGWY